MVSDYDIDTLLYKINTLNLKWDQPAHQIALYRFFNRCESDLCSCEATKAVAKKVQENIRGFNGIWTHYLRDTGAMLYQLSSEASLEAGQEQIQVIPVMWREWGVVCI